MNFSLKKYLQIALFWLGYSLISCLLILFCQLLLDGESATMLTALCAMVAFAEFIPGVYNLSNFFDYKKKCEKYTPVEGVIFNWSAGIPRPYGMVIIKEGDTEYTTGSYITQSECTEMVGKRVKYAIIEDVLFIYEVLE